MDNVWDYWMRKQSQVAYLLKEYGDIFPSMFLEMKGIAEDLGEMSI